MSERRIPVVLDAALPHGAVRFQTAAGPVPGQLWAEVPEHTTGIAVGPDLAYVQYAIVRERDNGPRDLLLVGAGGAPLGGGGSGYGAIGSMYGGTGGSGPVTVSSRVATVVTSLGSALEAAERRHTNGEDLREGWYWLPDEGKRDVARAVLAALGGSE